MTCLHWRVMVKLPAYDRRGTINDHWTHQTQAGFYKRFSDSEQKNKMKTWNHSPHNCTNQTHDYFFYAPKEQDHGSTVFTHLTNTQSKCDRENNEPCWVGMELKKIREILAEQRHKAKRIIQWSHKAHRLIKQSDRILTCKIAAKNEIFWKLGHNHCKNTNLESKHRSIIEAQWEQCTPSTNDSLVSMQKPSVFVLIIMLDQRWDCELDGVKDISAITGCTHLCLFWFKRTLFPILTPLLLSKEHLLNFSLLTLGLVVNLKYVVNKSYLSKRPKTADQFCRNNFNDNNNRYCSWLNK